MFPGKLKDKSRYQKPERFKQQHNSKTMNKKMAQPEFP
jgi:hypothetical protein